MQIANCKLQIDSRPLIVAVGEVLWDVFPDGTRLGGAPTNFAVHAVEVGARSALISCVGDDDLGRSAVAALRERDVWVDAVPVDVERPTGVVNVTLSNGLPSYEIVEGVAWDAIPWSDVLSCLAHEAHAVCFGTLAQRSLTSRRTVRRFVEAVDEGCLRVLDINFRQQFHDEDSVRWSLAHADVLKLSDEEVDTLRRYVGGGTDADTFLKDLCARFGLRLVILTRGACGCRVLNADGGVVDVRGEPREVVNTVGAGDAFTAVFVAHFLNGSGLDTCAKSANAVGGFVVTQDSGTPRLPKDFSLWTS